MLGFWWIGFIVSIVLGVIIGCWIYARFLSNLRAKHPDQYLMLGSPTLFNRSIRKGIALQKFIYSSQVHSLKDDRLIRICRFIRWFNPALVGIVLICYIFGLISLLHFLKG